MRTLLIYTAFGSTYASMALDAGVAVLLVACIVVAIKHLED